MSQMRHYQLPPLLYILCFLLYIYLYLYLYSTLYFILNCFIFYDGSSFLISIYGVGLSRVSR